MLGYYGKISNQFNLSQIKKRKIREFKDVLTESSGDAPPKFKQISSEELNKFKVRFRKEAAQQYRKAIQKRLIVFGAIIIIIWLILR